MVSDSIVRPVRIPPEERLNVFALVMYIPGPLGKSLDDLRRKLVPGCNPHAHVSLLPPRPLAVEWPVASQQVRAIMDHWAPFEVELTGIEIFPETEVIYIEVGRGAAELCRMHAAMNAGTLEFRDPFPYHPHITLAQELPREDVAATNVLANRLWREFPGPRSFPAEHAVFVKNSLGNYWIDLAEYSLGGSPAKS
ncbi:MAG TPA: 2'-5' RNA ligase family protein [Bryobacteraceae bacterium]|nr:2'-5' RNA ligase family protein [Bryobacteraceae bacterium]